MTVSTPLHISNPERVMTMSNRYFEINPILKKYPHARYYFLLGGRGTGKTFPVTRRAIKDAIDGKGLFAYVRRHKESLTSFNASTVFSVHNDFVEEYTGGQWNRIRYWQRRFWLEKWEENEDGTFERVSKSEKPIGAAYSMSTWETDKGSDFGFEEGVKNIIFDEVLSKAGQYLDDEWSIMQNVVSSLVRDRWEFDTKIFFLANPISKWANPYFKNLGINKHMIQNPGITEIKYPDEAGGIAMTSVFIYMAATADEIDPNRLAVYNTFFAFPNSKGKSKSITHGFWEMADSNRMPKGLYNESTKVRTVYAIQGEDIIAIDIMKYDFQSLLYLFIHPANEVKPKHYFFTLVPVPDRFAIVGRNRLHPVGQLVSRIFESCQVYYSDDSTADAFHGFLIERNKIKG